MCRLRTVATDAHHVDCEFIRADEAVGILDPLFAEPFHLKVIGLAFVGCHTRSFDVVGPLHVMHEFVQQRALLPQIDRLPFVGKVDRALFAAVEGLKFEPAIFRRTT